jgi:putative transcriptional regulator
MRYALRILLILFSFAAPAGAAEESANAVFLVASPVLLDPNFRQSVVLVTQPREGGPWGVIINRPLDFLLSDVFTDIETLRDRKDVLYFGGPVAQDGLVFLVRSQQPPPRAIPVLRDVYIISDIEYIEKLLRRSEPMRDLRVYSGYSGWAPGQLQEEIVRGGWILMPADADMVFEDDPARIWPELIKRATTRQTGHSPSDQVRPVGSP